MMIKRFLLILSVALLAVAACKKDNPQSASVSIEGAWELVSVSFGTKSAAVGDETVTVYVEFASGGKFTLYQQLGAGRFAAFSGSWTLSGETLSGKYDDGTSWASDYSVKADDGSLVLTAVTGGDVYTYRSCTIPDSVISSAR